MTFTTSSWMIVSPVVDYLNKIRGLKSSLKIVNYDLTDGLLATSVLQGLLDTYRNFRTLYVLDLEDLCGIEPRIWI